MFPKPYAMTLKLTPEQHQFLKTKSNRTDYVRRLIDQARKKVDTPSVFGRGFELIKKKLIRMEIEAEVLQQTKDASEQKEILSALQKDMLSALQRDISVAKQAIEALQEL